MSSGSQLRPSGYRCCRPDTNQSPVVSATCPHLKPSSGLPNLVPPPISRPIISTYINHHQSHPIRIYPQVGPTLGYVTRSEKVQLLCRHGLFPAVGSPGAASHCGGLSDRHQHQRRGAALWGTRALQRSNGDGGDVHIETHHKLMRLGVRGDTTDESLLGA